MSFGLLTARGKIVVKQDYWQLVIIGSRNGLALIRRQAIIWTNGGLVYWHICITWPWLVKSLSANGSTAFIWKLCCHWPKGLRQCPITLMTQAIQSLFPMAFPVCCWLHSFHLEAVLPLAVLKPKLCCHWLHKAVLPMAAKSKAVLPLAVSNPKLCCLWLCQNQSCAASGCVKAENVLSLGVLKLDLDLCHPFLPVWSRYCRRTIARWLLVTSASRSTPDKKERDRSMLRR